ncbi:MAG TPA: hypothetical protein VII00_06805 [bacterium]
MPSDIRRYSVNNFEGGQSSSAVWAGFSVLLLVILLTMYSLNFSVFAYGYLAFILFSQLIADRYVACTKCPHYGEACASIPYAGRITAGLFSRKKGFWTQTDWNIIRVIYMITLFTGPMVTFLRGEWVFFVITSLAGASWYIVHSEVACKKCHNNLVCPKGQMALVGNHQIYFLAAQFIYFIVFASIIKRVI